MLIEPGWIMWYNGPVNVPAVRKVAERPASATWRCGQIAAPGSQASPGIGPQVTSFPRLPLTRLSWYTPPVNVPAARTVASRLSLVKWRYNVWLCASPKIRAAGHLPLSVFPCFPCHSFGKCSCGPNGRQTTCLGYMVLWTDSNAWPLRLVGD